MARGSVVASKAPESGRAEPLGQSRPRHPRIRRLALRSPFLIPALIFIAVFIVFPILQTVYLSFVPAGGSSLGLDNYARVVGSSDTVNLAGLPRPPPYGALVHNILWISIHLPLSLFAGLFLALILKDMRGASIVKSAIFLGMVTPMIVGGVVLRFLFEGGVGLVPAFFGFLGVGGLSSGWTAHPETLLFGLIFGSVWLWTGFSLIVYSAGLTTIPQEYFEAAKIDGATPLRTFFRVTLPLLKPMTLTVVTMTVLWELKLFDIVFVAANAQGGVGSAADVLALQVYRYAFVAYNLPGHYQVAAAIATLLTLLTLVATVWMVRYMVKK